MEALSRWRCSFTAVRVDGRRKELWQGVQGEVGGITKASVLSNDSKINADGLSNNEGTVCSTARFRHSEGRKPAGVSRCSNHPGGERRPAVEVRWRCFPRSHWRPGDAWHELLHQSQAWRPSDATQGCARRASLGHMSTAAMGWRAPEKGIRGIFIMPLSRHATVSHLW